jgi:hypothetical protein
LARSFAGVDLLSGGFDEDLRLGIRQHVTLHRNRSGNLAGQKRPLNWQIPRCFRELCGSRRRPQNKQKINLR